MVPVHEYFREHSKVYYRWHTFGFMKVFHWFLLVLFLAGTATGFFLYGTPATPSAKAAVSMTALTSGTQGQGPTSVNTASVSPSSYALVLLWVENRVMATLPAEPTVSGNSLTWDKVATVTFNNTSSSYSRLTLFKALGASPTSGAVTIDFGGASQGHVVWSMAEYTGVSISAPVVQYATNRADSVSALGVTLSSFSSTSNVAAAGFGSSVGAAIDHNTGWTEIHDLASVPLPGPIYSRLETQWYNGNNTSAMGSMTAGGTANMAGIAVEIGASGGGGIADTCYWVGDTNPAVWNDATHWADSSGGTGGTCNGGFVPDSDDDVIFDGNGTNEVTVNADIDINSLTMTSGYTGTFDNATNDKAVAVAGDVTMDNARTDMGDATWTVGGSFDNQHVTTFNKNASTVTMTGTGKEIISNTRSLHNLTIANGASVSQPTSSAHVQVQDGIFRVIGTYSIASGKNTYVHGADLKVSSSGSITGGGTLKIAGTAKISQKDGVIDVANLHIFDDHSASYPIIAATYESANVHIYNNDPVNYGWVPSAGTYTFNGNVTFTGNTVSTNAYTIDNSVNNPNFVFKKHVSLNAGTASTINWTKGTGTITFSGTQSDQSTSVSHWLMNDNTASTTVSDVLGNNNGTFSDATGNPNTNTHGAAGKINGALSFDGTDDFIVVPHDSSLAPTTMSAFLWVNADDWDATTATSLLSKRTAPSSGYFFFVLKADGHVYVDINNGTQSRFDTGYTPPTGQWAHLGFTYDGHFVRFYVNGQLYSTSTDFNKTLASSSSSLTIGSNSSSGGYLFDGLLDDVRIFNSAISGNEVQYIYNSTIGTEYGVYSQTANFLSKNVEDIVVNNTAGTVALSANGVTTDSLTVASGAKFDLNGKNLGYASASSTNNNGTIRLQGNETLTNIANLDTDSGTVEYYGTGNYSALPYTGNYYNINFTGTGSYTLPTNLTVANDFTLNSSTLTAPSGTLTVGGDFANTSGTFSHNNGTLALNGTNQTISGSTTFNNFTKTTSSADTLTFTASSTQTIAGALTLQGTSGNLLTLVSTSTGTRWNIVNAGDAESVSYVDVQDSNNTGPTISATDSVNSGNNIGWLFSVAGQITVSGTIYTDEATTPLDCSGTSRTVALSVNGGTPSTTTCSNANGTFTFYIGTAFTSGDIITTFIDGATEKATTVTRANGSNMTINLFQNRAVIHHEDAGPITNANIGTYDYDNDTDILYTSNSNNLTLNDGYKLFIADGTTYTPGGTITTSPSSDSATTDGDIYIDSTATLNMQANALSIGGDYVNDGTFSYSSTQTTTLTATTTGHSLDSGTSSWYNITTSGTGGWITSTDTLNINGNLTLATGTFDNATNDATINVTGNVTMDNTQTDMGDATWTVSGNFDNYHVTTFNDDASTLVMNGGSSGSPVDLISNSKMLYNVTIYAGAYVQVPSTGLQIATAGTVTVNGNLSIAANKIFYNLGGDTKVGSAGVITGDGTYRVLHQSKLSQMDGTIDVRNFNIAGDHTASYAIVPATYDSAVVTINTLYLGDYSWIPSAGTYEFSGGVTFGGNLSSTGTYTINNSTNNPNFVFKGNVTFTNGTSTLYWTKGTGTITFGGSTTTTLTDSRTNKSDLGKIEVNGTDKTLNLGSSIVATSVNVYGSQTLGLGSSGYTTTITGSGTATSSPFIINGTLNEGTDSTVLFTGTSNTTVPSETFHNLEIKPTSGSPTYDVSTGTLSNPSAPSSMSAGAAHLSSGRHIVRSFTGSLYTFINNSGSCEIWKSTNGSSWSQQDANNNPACSGGDAFAVAIDGNDYIHLVYYDDGMVSPTPLKYITFNTLNDTFGTEETITGFSGSPIGNVGSVDIAIDSNNKPHVAYSYITTSYPAYSYIHYSNKVSASWVASAVGGKNANSHHIDIEINEDNIPEVYYILQGSGNAELGGAVGNANNATSFTHGLTAMAVNSTHPGLSAVIDNSGYTWLAYVDTNGYISLIKGDDAVFSPSTVTTNSNIGRAPSAAVVGSQIYVYYVNDQDDIAYDTYNGSTWGGENVVVEGTLQDVRVKWSYLYNNFGTSVLDFIYSDGTNIYWTGQAFGAGGNGTLKTNNYFTLGNGTNAVTLDVNTTDVNVDVDGTFTIASNATVVASDTAYMKVAGTYTASGTFTHSSGTLTFDGTSTQSITCGASSYYNITSTNSSGLTFSGNCTATGIFTHQQGGSTLTFQAGSTYAFASIAINGATNNLVTMASSNPTNQWYFNVSASTPTVTYVHATDSNASGGSTILADDGTSANGGNNVNWKFFTGTNVTGTIYTDEATTPLDCSGTSRTVALSVNGGTPSTTTCSNANGTFTFYIGTAFTSGDIITTFIDGATEKATTVTRANGSNMTINLFQNRAVIHHEDAGPITNANIGTYDYDNDTDILYTSNSNNLTLNDGYKLFIADGTTYTPGGTITTSPSSDSATTDGDIYIDSTATLNMQANALSIGGDYVNDGTFSYSSTQTTTLTATTTGHSLDSGTSSWYNITTSGTGGWITSTDTLNINGNLTLATGTFDNATNDATINVTGNVTMDNTRTDMGDATWTVSGNFDNYHVTTFNRNASTLVMDGTNAEWISGTDSKRVFNFTIAEGATVVVPKAASSNGVAGTFSVYGTLTINTGEVAYVYGGSLYLYSTGRITGGGSFRCVSTGKIVQKDGVMDVANLSVYLPHSSMIVVPATYESANVLFYSGTADSNTFISSAGTYTFNGNVTFQGNTFGAGTYTVDNSVNNPNFVFKGNVTFTNGTSTLYWTKGTGTITFSGTSAQTADFLDKSVEDIVISNTSATVSLTTNGVTTDQLTVSSGATFDLNGENLSYASSVGTYNDGTIRLQGGETLTNVSNLDTDSGTVVYTGTNTAETITLKDFAYYNLTITDANATKATFSPTNGSSLNVNNNFTLSSGTGTFDNATNDEDINVTGNVTMDNTRVDMGDATWTVSGNFDNYHVTTFNRNASTLVMNGTGKSIINSYPNFLYNVVINSTTTVGILCVGNGTGDLTVNGTLTVNTYIYIIGADSAIYVTETGKITGNGDIRLYANSAIAQQDGIIDINNLIVYYSHNGSTSSLVPATYDSPNVYIQNYTNVNSGFTPLSGTYTFTGNVTFKGNTDSTGTYTINNSTNNPNFIFKGNVTVDNGTSTLNWTKGTGTITVGGTSAQSLDFLGKTVEDINITNTSADVSITNDVTCDSLSASDGASIKVTAGKTITTDDISNIGGSSGNLVTLRSVTDASQWYLNVSGTPIVSYVDVKDSNASGGSEIIAIDGTSTDSGNNVNWLFSGIAITGTIYTDEAVTPLDCTTPRTVALSVNGATPETTTCSNTPSNGSFTIYIDTPTSGDVLTTYIDGATEKATTVTRADGTDMTINLFQNRAVIHHEDTGPITNANIGTYDYDNDTDILYTSNSNNLTLNDGYKLFIADGTTYTPGGTITTSPSSDSATTDGDIYIDSTATLNMQANALSIGGDYVNDGTFSYSSTQTTTLTATTTGHSLDSGTSSWYNITTSGTGGWITSTDTLNINGNLTLATGTFDNATNDATINVTGNVTMDNTRTDMGTATWTVSGDFDNKDVTTFNKNLSTLVMDGGSEASPKNIISRWNKYFNNITINGYIAIPSTSEYVRLWSGIATINGTLRVDSGQEFMLFNSSSDIRISSSGKITGAGRLYLYYGCSMTQQDGIIDVAIMVVDTNNNLGFGTIVPSTIKSASVTFLVSGSTNRTIVFSAGSYIFYGSITFGSNISTGTLTVDNSINNPNLVFRGNVAFSNGTSELIWTKGTGTITLAGTTAQSADFLDKSVEDIVISNTTATVSLTGNGVTTDSLTVDSGATFDLNGENLSYPSSQGTYNDGTIRLQGGETLTNVANLDTDSGTVTYYGDNGGGGSPFTIKDFGTTDYYNLTFNATLGTDVFRPADTLTVANDLTITQGTFDNATNDENINVTGNVTMDNTQTDMGDATWTVSGNWDSKDATTLSGGAGNLVMNGTNKSYLIGSASNTPNSLTIASGASITQAGSFYPIYNGGTFQVDGTYTVPSGKSSFVSWTTLRVSSTGKITGDGSMIVSATDISQQDGTIDVATLALYRVSDSDPIVPATFDSATVAFANATDTTSRTWSPATGTYTFNGNVTISGNIHNASTFTIDNSTNNPNFVFNGNVTLENGTSTLNWTKGTGTITAAGTSTQSLDFLGKTVEDINITNTSADVSITNDVTCDSLSASDNASIKVTAGKTITTDDISGIGGSSGNLVTLRSVTDASQWYLNVSGTPIVSYVDVKDSNASGGSEIIANDGTSVDSTNNVNWRFLPNNGPTNDSLTFTNPYGGSGNDAVADNITEWAFQAKVSDADNLTDIEYVLLRLANFADSTQPYEASVFKWDRASDTFSEITDTQDAITLTSTSSDSTGSGNQWTLDFKLKIDSDFATTATDYGAELYSLDFLGADDTDNYANFYRVEALSLSLDVSPATVNFAELLPTETLTETSTATITTNYPNGYSLSAHDAIVGSWSALLHTDSVTRIIDYAGTIASPTLWSGTGLGICVYDATGKDAKWGTGTTETDPNNKYAGVPETATIIHTKTGAPTLSDIVYIGYKLSVGLTQKSGDYSGIITYTATGVLQ